VLLARVKTNSWRAVSRIRSRVTALLDRRTLNIEDLVNADDDKRVAEFLDIARMVTFSDVARRSRNETIALRKNLAAMLESVEAHARAIEEFRLTPGTVTTKVGDCRKLTGIADASIDAIVTSPPYSIALDYVKNDEHALEALNVDIAKLRATMTGVRGRGPKQKLALYNEDMKLMFEEVARVLKPGAGAAFVIGDATVNGSEVTTTEQIATWAEAAGLRKERSVQKIVYGLYSVMKDEEIVIFRKDR